MIKEQYFRLHRSNDNSVPLLDLSPDSPSYLYQESKIDNPEVMIFQISSPVPRKPLYADFLTTSPNSIVGKEIYSVIAPLEIFGIQLLPAEIHHKNNVAPNYWAIHIYNAIECLNLEASNCEVYEDSIDMVEKIVLDQEKLKLIPLQQRLIFSMKEDESYQLFHVSIIEKMLETNPSGLRMVDIEDWSDRSFFLSNGGDLISK